MARGEDKIEQAIRLILSTYPGERPMRPQWGSTLRDFVFGGTGRRTSRRLPVRSTGRSTSGSLGPRSARCIVYPDADADGLLYIDIRYLVRGTNSPRNLVFPFYTIPERTEGEI